MNCLIRKTILISLLGILFFGLQGCSVLGRINEIKSGTGHAASEICSRTFVSNQDMDIIMKDVLVEKIHPLQKVMRLDIDHQGKTVSVSAPFFKGMNKKTAVYRECLGCTMAVGVTPEELYNQPFTPLESPILPGNESWPNGKAGIDPKDSTPDYDKIKDIVQFMFAEKNPDDLHSHINTHSVLVIHDGRLVAEKYSDGHSKNTQFVGWSMTKTVTAMLLGILNGQGKADYNDTLDSWKNTEKEAIKLKHIMHNNTGLEWNEAYAGQSDISVLLYNKKNMAEYVRSKPIVQPPGETINYATGNSMLIAELIFQKTGSTLQDVYNFYQKELFHKINVTSALIEHNANGVFIGCARAFMTARDWARLGLLLYNNGNWQGEQIIPESWIDFMRTPSPTAPYYGALTWLNSESTIQNGIPKDHFAFRGTLGQYIVIVPSEKLIVVRLGSFARKVKEPMASLDFFKSVKNIIDALPQTAKRI